jgi:hypothetical protein
MNNKKMDIKHLSIDEIVRLLKAGGYKNASEQIVQKDINDGCPVNDDGTINLFDYAAWLYSGGANGRV